MHRSPGSRLRAPLGGNDRNAGRKALVAAAASLTLLAAACTSGSSTTSNNSKGSSPSKSSKSGSSASGADLLIWTDAQRAPVIQKLANTFGKQNGVKVTVQPISDDLQSAYVTATTAGKGPDIVVGATDWIGNLVQNASISPVPLSKQQMSTFEPTAAKAVTYNGSVYGVPYATENLALYRNPTLVPKAPTTFEQMVKEGQKLVSQKKAQVPIADQVGQTGDVYHMEPFFTSAGGYLFGQKSNGDYDPKDLGTDKAGAMKWGQLMHKYGEAGQKVFKRSIDANNSIGLFSSGKTPFLVSGPWAIPNVKSGKVKYALSAVPGFAGQGAAKPFVSVQAFFVSSKSKNSALAQQFASNYALEPQVEKALFKLEPRPPALTSVYNEVSKTDSDVRGFYAAGKGAQVLPQIPAMNTIYDTFGKAEAAIVGGANPSSTLKSATTQIQKAVSG